MRSGLALAALSMLLAAGMGAAQAHDHEAAGGIHLLSDLGPTGATNVAALNHFTILVTGDDDVPDFHQDIPVRVLLNGRVVLELDADAGHDYDGVRETWITFGEVGPYAIEALDGAGNVVARLDGQVRPQLAAGAAFGYEWNSGFLVGGTDISLEFSDDRVGPRDYLAETRLLTRVTSSAPLRGNTSVSYSVAPQGPGIYQQLPLSYDARPAEQETPFPAFFLGAPFGEPPQAASAEPLEGPPVVAVPPTEVNFVQQAQGDGLRLVGTYDPWTRVGTETLQTLGVLALGPDGHPAGDVRVSATLTDALGRVHWSTPDGFAPAGWWSLMTLQGVPGVYSLVVDAKSPHGTASLTMPYVVTPPTDPASASTVAITLDGWQGARQGHPMDLVLRAQDGTGAPFTHSDVVVDILGPAPADGGTGAGTGLLLRSKVHTHDSGAYRLTFVPPSAGDYTVILTPSPLEARPVVLTSYVQEFAVAPADDTDPARGEADAQDTPLPSLLAALALLAAFGVARRRM